MNIVLFSTDENMISELTNHDILSNAVLCSSKIELLKILNDDEDSIVVAEYNSISHELNDMMSNNYNFKNLIVLEKVPEIIVGKSLIYRGVKAYGNSRMLSHHFKQMIETVQNGNIWSYPELTMALSHIKKNISLESLQIINNRLSKKEQEVIYLILEGLTNDAIASKLNITQRTVKAHTSSIFSKLHVNDRLSLVLLLTL